MKKPRCCFMYEEFITQCQNDAEFEISENTRNDPDNYIHACEKHVGSLLGSTVDFPDCKIWTVSYIGEAE